MRKGLIITVAASLVGGTLFIPSSAALKAGAVCGKLNQISISAGLKYTCIKYGKKLVWDKGVRVLTPAANPVPSSTPNSIPSKSPTPVASSTPVPTPTFAQTPTQTPTPTPAPTPAKTFNTLWEKYNFAKPTSSDSIIKAATDDFISYTSIIRNSTQEIKVVAQAGVDPTLISWVKDGATYVARRFAYPKLSRPFVDFIAIDQTWLESNYIAEGYPTNFAKDNSNYFCGGAPACGGTTSNLWNYASIQKNNYMVTDKSGMTQTPGHEFFHAIQENLSMGNLAGPSGEKVPNWFWEGPAMFVGLQTAGVLGFADYQTIGRPSMTTRYKNGDPKNRSSNLIEIKANNGVIDPYAIGFAATEFLVAQIGVEKMVNVYVALGQGKNFEAAFRQGTDIELSDFYSMFEEVRAILGFTKS